MLYKFLYKQLQFIILFIKKLPYLGILFINSIMTTNYELVFQ